MDRTEGRLARLAHPEFTAEPPADLPRQFVADNRLWLLLTEAGVDIDVADERRRLSRLREELAALDDLFTDARYLLIKHPDLPKLHRDIDILVVNGWAEVDRVLRDRGYAVTGDNEPYKRGYARTVDGVELDFDVHAELSWWGNSYLDPERLWADHTHRRLAGQDLPVPNPVGELLVAVASGVFGEIRLPLYDVLHVWHLLHRGVDVAAAGRLAEGVGWSRQFDYYLNACAGIYAHLYAEELPVEFPGDLTPSSLPYRFPLMDIVSLRGRRVLDRGNIGGYGRAAHDLRGYALELLQLGIDHVFYRTGLPQPAAFNMRFWLQGDTE
jgi:hypothetical protein